MQENSRKQMLPAWVIGTFILTAYGESIWWWCLCCGCDRLCSAHVQTPQRCRCASSGPVYIPETHRSYYSD